MNKWKIRIIILVLLCASCTTKLPPPTEFETAALLGMIYDADGTPVNNVEIEVDSDSGPASDINGRFILPGLNRGKHRISIKKDGYEKTETDFPFFNKSQILYLRMYTPSQLLEEAKTFFDAGSYEKSIAYVNRSLSIDKRYYPALYLKAVILFTQNKHQEANNILNELISMGCKTEEINILKNLCTKDVPEE